MSRPYRSRIQAWAKIRVAVSLLFLGLSLTIGANASPSAITAEAMQRYGIKREEALFTLGEESNNPRYYDPAIAGSSSPYIGMVFSGLVTLDPQMQVVPDI